MTMKSVLNLKGKNGQFPVLLDELLCRCEFASILSCGLPLYFLEKYGQIC